MLGKLTWLDASLAIFYSAQSSTSVQYTCILHFATSQGTLGFPEGCERASCDVYVQWALGTGDTVQFELEGVAEGWVAVGVSANQVMGGDGIDDMFACQRDATTDAVYAQDTYDPENQSPRSNNRDSVCFVELK